MAVLSWLLVAIYTLGVFSGSVNVKDVLASIPKNTGFNSSSLLSTIAAEPDCCLVIIAGADWDAHFRAWISRGHWADVIKTVNLQWTNIDFGYIIYSGGDKKGLPVSLFDAVTLGSYEVRFFKHGSILRNFTVEQAVRDWRNDYHLLASLVGDVCATHGVSQFSDPAYSIKKNRD